MSVVTINYCVNFRGSVRHNYYCVLLFIKNCVRNVKRMYSSRGRLMVDLSLKEAQRQEHNEFVSIKVLHVYGSQRNYFNKFYLINYLFIVYFINFRAEYLMT